jgi:hypothetical protein
LRVDATGIQSCQRNRAPNQAQSLQFKEIRISARFPDAFHGVHAQ